MSKLTAMDLQPVLIDAEMVAKLYRLAMSTTSEASNDDCEEMAVILLDAALDAVLEKFEGQHGVIDLTKAGAVKFDIRWHRNPAVAAPQRKGGSKR